MTGGSKIGQSRPAAPLRERLDWIDAMKGLGIVAVVAGHVWTRGPVRDALYAFHMPLFFVLAGYTARAVPTGTLLRNGVRSLGLPFLCFSLLLLAADFLIEGLRGVRPIFASWSSGAATILLATEKLRGPFTILWFIPCLFFARLVWNMLAAKGRRADALIMLPAMLLVAALALWVHYHGKHSPLGLLAVPGAILFIWMGALWRLRGMPSRFGLLACGLLALPTVFLLPPFEMKMGELGFPYLSVPGAVGFTILLAWLVQRLPAAATGVLAALGRASLVIMYVHVAFIHYLAPYAPPAALFVVAVVMSFALDRSIRRYALARRLLLGEARTAG
ncbi:MAG: acyltransferase family protein [Sphingomonadales bacterium]|nr:acyltransferase family protein [Sphingomonadales bacterium]